MRTAYLTHPDCLLHEMGSQHPERPERLSAIEDQLITQRLMDLLRHYEAPLATDEQLLRVHDAAYLDSLEAKLPSEGYVMLDPDTWLNPHSLRAARRAAGAGAYAVDLVMSGEMDNAFCAVRPPGHHAEHNKAMGFCFFNNVAVAAAHAIAVHGLERVAIVDFDVHHGNGTEDIFRHEQRILLCSTFQHPYYPHTVTKVSDRPPIIHAPLKVGHGGADFRTAVSEVILPALDAFAPQLVLISAGFDAHHEEMLAGLKLDESDYTWVTEQVMAVAKRYAEKRVVSVLEGGYSLHALGRSAAAHIKTLLELD